MSKLVETVEQIIQNVDRLHAYGEADKIEIKFHNNKIKNGKVFIALERADGFKFAPSKFAGYIENDLLHVEELAERDGRKTNKRIGELLGLPLEKGALGYGDLDAEFLAYCDERDIVPSIHHKARRYWLIKDKIERSPKYYWTKVWGQPRKPGEEALVFNALSYRDRAQQLLVPGDIVVYLTSDTTHADPAFKGRVAGAVEIAGAPVMAKDLGIIDRARPEDFREDGSFRWPYGLTISRSWRVLDAESNDNLIKDHGEKGLQGAAFVHDMRTEEIAHFQSLRVQEQKDGAPSEEVFTLSLRRPWRQKLGSRSSTEVNPGTDLYVAWIHDAFGMTVKIGSGKYEDRIAALNKYRRPSQGEHIWALAKGMHYHFLTVENARDAEDYMLREAYKEGFGSRDHSEFLVNIKLNRLRVLFGEAVDAVLR